MGNHTVDCEYCGEDMRGLSGVPGCKRLRDANNCVYYQDLMKKLAERQSKELKEKNNE